MGLPILSISIPHIVSREGLLRRLLDVLEPQITDPAVVEINIETDRGSHAGGMTTGCKRNRLLQRARGEFVCSIDDDDLVADSYVSDILSAIRSDPLVDAIGIQGLVTRGGEKRLRPELFIHSVTCKGYYDAGGIHYRTPNHTNPIRTKIARSVKYLDITHDEDRRWCIAIKPLLKTEVMINHPIYFYMQR